jgi:hypothetical protein
MMAETETYKNQKGTDPAKEIRKYASLSFVRHQVSLLQDSFLL